MCNGELQATNFVTLAKLRVTKSLEQKIPVLMLTSSQQTEISAQLANIRKKTYGLSIGFGGRTTWKRTE